LRGVVASVAGDSPVAQRAARLTNRKQIVYEACTVAVEDRVGLGDNIEAALMTLRLRPAYPRLTAIWHAVLDVGLGHDIYADGADSPLIASSLAGVLRTRGIDQTSAAPGARGVGLARPARAKPRRGGGLRKCGFVESALEASAFVGSESGRLVFEGGGGVLATRFVN
jgi:hypothetical protein